MRLTFLALWWACHPPNGDRTPHDSPSLTDDSDSNAPDDSGDDSGTLDRDGDGWVEPDDCDDDDPEIHPEAPEACVNNRDDDCNGVVDRCELELDLNVTRRFIDPDADHQLGGFGSAVAYLERDGGVTLWMSPQTLGTAGTYRAASADAWPLAQISGFESEGIAIRPSMMATEGDFDDDGSLDLVIAEVQADRVIAHLFYETVIGQATTEDHSASVAALGGWGGAGPGEKEGVTFPSVYAVGDLTTDGHDDLLFSGTSNSWLIAGPISGDVDPSGGGPAVAWSVREAWSATAVDFDGDGTRDLATANPTDGTGGAEAGAAYVYLQPGSSVLEPETADRAWYGTYGKYGPTGEAAGSQIETGDFDGDGRADLNRPECGHLGGYGHRH